MNWLVAIAEFVVNEILAVPAYLIGIITAVGLIALRKSAGQVIGARPGRSLVNGCRVRVIRTGGWEGDAG